MRTWRIAYENVALDRSCEGARKSGGGAPSFGGRFLRGGAHLTMRMPSTIVGEGVNFLINPEHPAYKDVALSIVRTFSFDPRMLKLG
jgi:hypothetical protein